MAIELSDATIGKIVAGLITGGSNFAKSESEQQLRNTKSLLRHYRLLENHLNIEVPTVDEDVPLSKYEISLYSLLGYRVRSKEMMEFVNNILDRYRQLCAAGTFEDGRRYNVIKKLYLIDDTLTRVQLADYYKVDEKTIRRDERKAIDDLSVMIFGIDALNDMSKTRRTAVHKSPK